MSQTEWVIRVPRRLVSVNRGQGYHWRVRHRLTKEWERDIWALAQGKTPPTGKKQRLAIIREVPSRRDFIRDTDNLFAACKPLLDALKRLRYIVDDSQPYLELAQPAQVISNDKRHWTTIAIREV